MLKEQFVTFLAVCEENGNDNISFSIPSTSAKTPLLFFFFLLERLEQRYLNWGWVELICGPEKCKQKLKTKKPAIAIIHTQFS